MLEWKPEFATGVEEIDADHQQLIRGLNHLEAAMQRGQGSKIIDALLTFLETYSNQHFHREELCMQRLNCPTAAANRAAHDQFRVTFANAKSRLQSPSATALVAFQVHRELCDWITNHIMKVDAGLRQCVGHKPR